MGPIIVPIKKLDSNLANFLVRFDRSEISAMYAKAAGLVAEPINPLINLPKMSRGNRYTKSKIFCSTRNKGVIRAMIETEQPISPITAIFRLPYLSDALPHEALVIAHATAEIEKIVDVSMTDKPKSLAKGGTSTKAKD